MFKPNSSGSFSRRSPDIITEEIVSLLLGKASFEFKALFDVVYANLRARNKASGGEEMLRLRAYEKLQTLVRCGVVKKTAKNYKGLASPLLALSLRMKEAQAEMTTATAPATTKDGPPLVQE